MQRTPDGKASATVKERIKSARRTAYSLMGAGLHGLNGTGPKVAKHLINVYVTPVLLHSLEALILSDSDYKSLEQFYRTLLRQVQHLPSNCANPAVYLLLGCIPIEGQIHIRMLTFFCSVLRRPSIGRQVIERQLAVKNVKSHSWTVQIRNILAMYNLPSAYQLLNNPPTKNGWKCAVEKAVCDHWLTELQEKASTMSTLQFLDPFACDLENLHSTWGIDADPMEVHMATVKVKLLIQRYPLTGLQYSGKKKSKTCPLCQQGEETVEHFLLICKTLCPYRPHYLQKIYMLLTMSQTPLPENTNDLTRLILDPVPYLNNRELVERKMEKVSRHLVFKLHNERSILLGGSCSYNSAGLSIKRKSKS